MDRLTQLEDAIDEMARVFSISVNYLNEPQNADPVQFKKTQDEVVAEICKRAKQIEILIESLPGINHTEDEQMTMLQDLEKQLHEANQEYQKAVQTAEFLVKQVTEAIDAISKDQTISMDSD